jgi:hypothetical protein
MLRSALQDIKETTLAAVSGLLGKLNYLASLRRGHDQYHHWGMALVHGSENSERAIKTAHSEVVTEVLRSTLATLAEDLQRSSQGSGVAPRAYVEAMRAQFNDLLPALGKDPAAASHLNSVLLALSSLEKKQERSTRSTS